MNKPYDLTTNKKKGEIEETKVLLPISFHKDDDKNYCDQLIQLVGYLMNFYFLSKGFPHLEDETQTLKLRHYQKMIYQKTLIALAIIEKANKQPSSYISWSINLCLLNLRHILPTSVLECPSQELIQRLLQGSIYKDFAFDLKKIIEKLTNFEPNSEYILVGGVGYKYMMDKTKGKSLFLPSVKLKSKEEFRDFEMRNADLNIEDKMKFCLSLMSWIRVINVGFQFEAMNDESISFLEQIRELGHINEDNILKILQNEEGIDLDDRVRLLLKIYCQ